LRRVYSRWSIAEYLGHLGIFVSAKVATKEGEEFARTLDIIDVLPPGLYEAVIAAAEKQKLDLSRYEIVDAPHSHAAAEKAIELVRLGKAQALMKGSLHTDELMAEVVRKDTGLRTERRISHVFIMDVPTYHKPLFITDAAVNIFPSIDDKADILKNAIELAQALDIKEPKVAILSAVETVNAKIPSTIDAAALCKMAERGQITGGVLDDRSPLTTQSVVRLRRSSTSHPRSAVKRTSSSRPTSRLATCSPRSLHSLPMPMRRGSCWELASLSF
jgi:phosphate acetyltransferase